MLRPGTFALTVLLAALSAIGPLTTDMYLPSLPDIARLLGASTAQVQLTISAYLVGFAIGQILYGPLACLLYTSDAADEEDSVDLGGRRIIKKKKKKIKVS